MPLLFAATLFVSSALLFAVQPMIAKAVLPALGGSPAVWNTCVAFFQATLLAGYAAVHAATARLGIRHQAILHVGLLLVSALLSPLVLSREAVGTPPPGTDPTLWLLGLLATTVGLPSLVVASTAPLLQRWYAGLGHPAAEDPYSLYGASNLGSLLALLGYPLAIEPALGLARQSRLWAAGYGLLAALTLGCASAAWRSPAASRIVPDADDPRDRPDRGRWLRWAALACVPSSLMLGVTTYLATDIVAFPLLWVIPLALYLLTFILAFARRPLVPPAAPARALPPAAVLLAALLCAGWTSVVLMPVHLATFVLAALACHGELARSRPPARHLTAFYLAISAGGVLGGLFNALAAPVLFDRVAEYPLALVLACLALPGSDPSPRSRASRAADAGLPLAIFALLGGLFVAVPDWPQAPAAVPVLMLASGLSALVVWTHRSRPVRFALGLGAVLLAVGMSSRVEGRLLHQERDFFGVLRVTRTGPGEQHRLFHGSTLHGQQCLDPPQRREPLTYYTRTGPVGEIFAAFRARRTRPAVAVVGLGAGTLACYAEPAERWTFYEIDPAVVRIAREVRYFTYLNDCRAAGWAIVEGDARRGLRAAPRHGSGLIVLDAFSSDATPVHLLTREAMALYRDKLADGGLIACNISSRYLDLEPVLGAVARDAGLVCRVRRDLHVSRAERAAGRQASIWAVLAARPGDLGPLADDPRWPAPRPGGAAWTDDYSNIIRCFRIRRR
ncbi:MAG TPA: fused MFS/spermidine synthase [Isosphaeraceae bacterium]